MKFVVMGDADYKNHNSSIQKLEIVLWSIVYNEAIGKQTPKKLENAYTHRISH